MAAKSKQFKAEYIEVSLDGVRAFTFPMKVKDLLQIYYVAVRGIDDEEGAVQRPLSKRRVQSIKDYILQGNTFFNSFILNWTEESSNVEFNSGKVSFDLISSAAQAIDGQHRLAGLEDAMEENVEVGERTVIVTLCVGLSTQQAATIFLNINTEQRPVPKSLLYDLFGEVGNDPKHAINRARDIAQALNDDPDSPLYRLIKFPGSPRGVGKIELSTFVTALKKGLEPDGEFGKRGLKSLEHQTVVVSNYFKAIRRPYQDEKLWGNGTQNPFLRAAGFNGAIEFLLEKLIFKCAEKGSFTVETIGSILKLEEEELLTWEDLKGQDGKTARRNVVAYLERGMTKSIENKDAYSF
ncbi:hypothetical protein CP97_12970 [Aurantiacibacter atlanticus]|uniref:DGQHR domain-containing protein n=1 Tax=Aurantiacibacter atlanticus TaxID=1648404 RepID=A0A0H4VEH8_9SPHN|nr:DGQHR domain-containing protein [Aurantiacibacter atlanticus]AKQ42755.1 hypothetical protein CP97_12970 [Aurantiacibacter atlanticus]MDF1835379.1 DGQHR domain-containing protein [Alteraurantiacibacter sp. bin_em_oilr2.035]